MFSFLWLSIYNWLRPLIKWILRKTTKLCELQRICYGEPAGFPRSSGVEMSLIKSRSRDIQEMIVTLNALSKDQKLYGKCLKSSLESAVNTIIDVKKINPYYHRQFIPSFVRCTEHIWGYLQLVEEVESLRVTLYDCNNSEHEKKLLNLWTLLMPDTELEGRVTKQWQDIGFQGDDPKTDFRGMGLLGLENLVFFAEEYSGPVKHVLLHSLHPQYGYAFAIVGINLTSMAYHLLKDGAARTHIFNTSRSMPSLRLFHQFYCYLFYEFDRFWLEAKPKDIMDFKPIRDKFENNIRTLLACPSTVFRINLPGVDTV